MRAHIFIVSADLLHAFTIEKEGSYEPPRTELDLCLRLTCTYIKLYQRAYVQQGIQAVVSMGQEALGCASCFVTMSTTSLEHEECLCVHKYINVLYECTGIY